MRAPIVLDLAGWARPTDPVDELVLERCTAATLDVGCGPGRMVLELNRRGVPALGIDLAPEAVRQVVASGGLALRRSVFGRVPGEGRWPTALLLDGCVGIGGAPERLLQRIRQLLSPGGVVYVEHDPDPERLDRSTARVHARQFDWAVVGWRHLARAASSAGLEIEETWTVDDRSFAGLRAPEGTSCS
jgi:SAM-dependent methyltransferase